MAIAKEMFENFIADNNRYFLEEISENDNIIYHFSKMPIADKEHRVDAIYFVPVYRHTLLGCDTVVLNHSSMSLFALIVDKKETYIDSANVAYQRYIDQGIFEVKETVYYVGTTYHTSRKTLITPKGQVYLAKKVSKEYKG